MTLRYDDRLSNVAFNFNLRRYSTAFGSFVDTRTILKLIAMGEEKLVRNVCIHQCNVLELGLLLVNVLDVLAAVRGGGQR